LTKCVIFLAGEIYDYTYMKKYVTDADMIICADGGTTHAKRMGIEPDIILGDMDSIDPTILESYRNTSVEILEFNIDKDKTDSHLAIGLALERKYDDIVIIGAIGTLPDHSVTNIMLLEYIMKAKAYGRIITENSEMTVSDGKLEITADDFDRISLIPLSDEVTGITTIGLKFSLCNDTLYRTGSRGTSNSFISDKAKIEFDQGVLLVIKARCEKT